MKKIFAIVAFLISTATYANPGDLNIQIRTVGVHFSSGNHNDDLHGAGVEYEPVDRFKVGYLYARNSFQQTRYSNYLQLSYDVLRQGTWSVSLGATAGDNYKTRTQSDVKLFGMVGVCNQLVSRMQLCANFSPVSTGHQAPAASLVAKFLVN